MGHELTESDTMFWLAKDGVPWHGLGTPLLNAPKTAEEAIVAAGLDWEVEKRRLFYPSAGPVEASDGEKVTMFGGPEMIASEYFSVVRKDNHSEIGTCKAGFEPLQNREAFRFFDQVVGEGKCEYRVAGSLKGGRIIWVLVTLPEFLEVGPGDRLIPYLLWSNSHDGSQAIRLQMTTIRTVCNNTLMAAHMEADKGDEEVQESGEVLPDKSRVRSKRVLMRVYHTKDALQKVRLAADFLSEIREDYQKTQELYRQMAQTPVLAKQVEWFLHELEPDPKDPTVSNRNRVATRGRLLDYYEHGPGSDLPTAKGTAWGLFNAAAYYIDHERGRLSTDNPSKDQKDRALTSAWFGSGLSYKERALELCGELM